MKEIYRSTPILSLTLLVSVAAFSLSGLPGISKQISVAAFQDARQGDLAEAGSQIRQEAAKMVRTELTARRFAELASRIEEEGRIRVIIRLRVPFDTKAEIEGGIKARAQRGETMRLREELLSLIPGIDQGSIKRYEVLPFLGLSVNAAGLESLRLSSDVFDIEEDKINQPSLVESTRMIGATKAWDAGLTGQGQVVAIIDTGVDKAHPMLSGKVLSEACFSTNDSSQDTSSLCPGGVASSTASDSALPCTITGCGHGTSIAAIAAGNEIKRGSGILSGVARDSNLIAIQVFSRATNSSICSSYSSCIIAYDSDIISGMERVYTLRNDLKIAAVNLSLSSTVTYDKNCDSVESATKAVVDLLHNAGIATIASSGNAGRKNELSSPACISTMVSVGSTIDTAGGTIESYSNSAEFLSLLAPGSMITTAVPGGQFATFAGTSMATAHVSGAWALLRQKKPTITISETLSALILSGDKITDTNGISKPRIRVDNAISIIDGVPFPPSNLTATSPADGPVLLQWADTSSNETGFYLERRNGAAGMWELLVVLPPDTTTYQDSTVGGDLNFYYRIQSFNATGGSAYSAIVGGPDSYIKAPSGLAAKAVSPSEIDLTWTDNSSNEMLFILQVDVSSDDYTGSTYGWEIIASLKPNTTSYQHKGLRQRTNYKYRIFAIVGSANSSSSNEVSATTQEMLAPSALVATVVLPSEINLSWRDNSTNEAGFILQRKISTSDSWATFALVGANITSYKLNAQSGASYTFRVCAIESTAISSPSNEVSVATETIPAPSGLLATAASPSRIDLTWGDNSTSEAGFLIQRKSGANSVWAPIATLGPNVTSYQSTGLLASTTYSYRVFYLISGTLSSPSSEASATTLQLPAPGDLAATAISANQINLTWTDTSTNETGFSLQRRIGATGNWQTIVMLPANMTNYQHRGLNPGTTYFYRIYGLSGLNQSPASNEASATTPSVAAPTGLVAVAVSATQINLVWRDNSTNETGFTVERRIEGETRWSIVATLKANVNVWQNTGLTAATKYYYRVTTTASDGQTATSNEASATTPSATASRAQLAGL